MEGMIPFVKRIATSAKKYIYDVNSNEILEVNSGIYDILEDCGKLSDAEIIEKYGAAYRRSDLIEGATAIDKAQEEGLLSLERPNSFRYPHCEDEIMHTLQSKLGQLVLGVTEECNLRCKYCIYSGHYFYVRSHRRKFMSFDVASRAIDFYLERSPATKDATISFYGGEPLLAFKLIRMCVEYVRQNWPERSVIFSITTNGTLLSDEVCDFLSRNSFRLSVSLDGPQPVHDRWRVYRNQKGTFNKIVANLRRLKGNHNSYFNTLVSFLGVVAPPYDLLPISDFYSDFELIENTFSPRNLRYGHVNTSDTDLLDEFDRSKSKSVEGIKALAEQYREYIATGRPFEREIWLGKALFEDGLKIIHNRSMCALEKELYPNGICLPGARKLFVDCDGKFYMCERVNFAYCIGDIEHGFNATAIMNLLSRYCEISSDECRNCWAVRLCDACFVRGQKGEGLDYDRKKEQCDIYRQRMEWFLKLYCSILERNPQALDFLRESETDEVERD